MLDTVLALAGSSVLFILGAVVVLLGLRLVPNNKMGIVEKRISGRGSCGSSQ